MKRDIFWFIAILIFIAAFGLWVYPTPWYYTTTGADGTFKNIYKVNRFTGDVYMFGTKWVKVEPRQ